MIFLQRQRSLLLAFSFLLLAYFAPRTQINVIVEEKSEPQHEGCDSPTPRGPCWA